MIKSILPYRCRINEKNILISHLSLKIFLNNDQIKISVGKKKIGILKVIKWKINQLQILNIGQS